MSVKILSSNDNGLVFEVHIPFETAMLNGEQRIERVLNEAGANARVMNGYSLNAKETENVVTFERLASGQLTGTQLALWVKDSSSLNN